MKIKRFKEYSLNEGVRKNYNRTNFSKYPYVIHFSKDGMADAIGADSVQELIDNVVVPRNLKAFAIYKQDKGFHSTTQDEFLKVWYDKDGDGYWSNRAKKEPDLKDKEATGLGLMEANAEKNVKTAKSVESIKKVFADLGYSVVKDKLDFDEIGKVSVPELTLYLDKKMKSGSEREISLKIRNLLKLDDSPRVEAYPDDENGKNIVVIDLFESEKIDEADTNKTFIVKVDRDRGNGRHSIRYVKGTLEDLIGYFGYTLEIGNSYKRSINRNPKTIKAFMKALSDSYSEKEAAIYNRTSIELVPEIPADTPASEISDQTTKA